MQSLPVRSVYWWKTALSFAAALVLFAACIPSEPAAPKPEPLPTAAAPLPTAVEPLPTPTPADTTAKPPVQNRDMPLSDDGKPHAALQMDMSAEPNASVVVQPLEGGAGFDVKGTFNLAATIVPNGPGKWKLSGQFSMAEADFAVGAPEISIMGSFDPTGSGGIKADASIIMITVPVRPPAAKAPEGTAVRNLPISLDIDAPEKAQFTVTLSQMQASS